MNALRKGKEHKKILQYCNCYYMQRAYMFVLDFVLQMGENLVKLYICWLGENTAEWWVDEGI